MSSYLFHYTSVNAANSIVMAQSLRATNITTFDDENELFGGLDPISCYLEGVRKKSGLNGLTAFFASQISRLVDCQSMFNFYCISFCKEANYDFMWKNYAKDGCCLIFDKDKLLKAFLMDVEDSCKNRDREKSVVSGDFLPCVYLKEKDISPQITNYLQSLKQIENIKGNARSVPYNYSFPNTIVKPFTWEDVRNPQKIFDEQPCIDIPENFLNLILPALQLKFAGTTHEFEREKEERIVFVTPSNCEEEEIGKKKFINIGLNRSLFFDAMSGIKINPSATDRNRFLTGFNSLNEQLISQGCIDKPINIM